MVKLGDLVKYTRTASHFGIEQNAVGFGKVVALKGNQAYVHSFSESQAKIKLDINSLKINSYEFNEKEPLLKRNVYSIQTPALVPLNLLIPLNSKITVKSKTGTVIGYSPSAGEYLVEMDEADSTTRTNTRSNLEHSVYLSDLFTEGRATSWHLPAQLTILDSNTETKKSHKLTEEKSLENKEKDSTMTQPDAFQKFMTKSKEDAKDAGYRIVANQSSKTIRRILSSVLSNHGVDKKQIKAVNSLLDTELGEAGISYALGLALTYAPKIKDDPRIKKLAAEFRIEGMASAGNIAVNELIQAIGPDLQNIFMSLPEVAKEELKVVEKVELKK